MPTAEIRNGNRQVPTGSYLVSIGAENQTALLQEMETRWAWRPTVSFIPQMPIFAGVLNETQVLWLLEQDEVFSIEEDLKTNANGPPIGVNIGGTFITASQILDGSRQIPTDSYLVGFRVEDRAAVLEEMLRVWSWTPTFPYGSQMPMFAGLLNQTQVLWLLEKEQITHIEEDLEVIYNRPPGVKINGVLVTLVDIQSGRRQVPTDAYFVNVREENKTGLLEEMSRVWAWTPVMRYSDALPMFVGVLNQTHVLWLLQREEVTLIEEDGDITAAGPPDGVTIDGALITLADLEDGGAQIPTGSYLVGVNVEDKAALLDEMRRDWSWEPAFQYSSLMPMFAGVLNQTHMLWLLQREEVLSLAKENTLSAISGPPDGIRFNGTIIATQDILNGTKAVATGGYLIGVNVQIKAAFLEELRRTWSWTPTFTYSSALPMFAGVLNQTLAVWLLQKQEVASIEYDADIYSVGPPTGVYISGRLITKEEIDAGHVQVPTGMYIVTAEQGSKASLLEQLRAEFAWTPNWPLPMLSTFAGWLDQTKVRWLLDKAEVARIQSDQDTSNPSTSNPYMVGGSRTVSDCRAVIACLHIVVLAWLAP